MGLLATLRRKAGAFLQRSTGFSAASGSPRWSSWETLGAPASMTQAAAPIVARRASWAAANVPIAASLADAYVNAVWPDAPSIRAGSKRIEDGFARWLAANGAPLRELVRSQFVNGEGLALMRIARDGGLRLQVLNPEQLDRTVNRDPGNGSRIIAGVEFDAAGEVVAYHILADAPDQTFAVISTAVRIDAADVIHLFEPKVAGQVRGISELTPVLPRLTMFERLLDALMARAGTAALFAGFITPDATAFGDAAAAPPEADLSLEPGSMRVLPPGSSVTFPNMPTADDMPELLRLMQKDICSGVGVPYEMATGDLSETNYSSAKLGIEGFKRRIKAFRASVLVPRGLEPLFYRWHLIEMLRGRAGRSVDVAFLFPEFQSIDPLKDVQADVASLNAGLRSRAEIIAARGRDIQDVDREIAADSFKPRGTSTDANATAAA